MKLIKITALIAIALTSNGLLAQPRQAPKVEHLAALPPTVDLGVYDNLHKFENVRTMTYEQIWYRWDTPGKLLSQLKALVAKGRIPLVTLEPYPISSIGCTETMLSDIAAGKYDGVASAIAKEINALGSPVFVRWGPEMDIPNKPWSVAPAADYIAAFRQFVTTFRKTSPTSPIVWSPVGNQDCERYYPGDDVVDYTGYSLYELPTASIGWFGREQSFADWMDQKYPTFVKFNKPIIIPELGICDTPAKQKAWMQAAFAAVPNYPLVKALIYYNSQDKVSWKKWGGAGAPSWFINPAVFSN
jgi:beta-mannanase